MADFHAAVSETVKWLRDHNVDVILIGLRYARSMVRDAHYQAIRRAIADLAKEQGVLRIGRYEAEEVLEKLGREQHDALNEAALTESSYVCMAEYLARAIVAGLFVKETSPTPQ